MKQSIKPLAGYCMEEALWQMIKDLSKNMMETRSYIPTMDNVFLEDDEFTLEGTIPVSEKEAVWHLGALVCQMSSGHEVFGGRGLEYQRANVHARLPILCKEHAAITTIIHSCMSANEGDRISLSELYDRSSIGFKDCKAKNSVHLRKTGTVNSGALDNLYLATAWPEEIE